MNYRELMSVLSQCELGAVLLSEDGAILELNETGLRLLHIQFFQDPVNRIIGTFAWHVVLPFGMGFLFLRSRYLRRCMMLYIKIPAATLTL